MSHVSRFKIVYIQLAISVGSAIAGELGPMKELTDVQLRALTWVVWAILFVNVVVAAGNTLVASLQHAPDAAPPKAAPPPQSTSATQPEPETK